MIGVSASAVSAACQCACVNGRMQPLCANKVDLPPVCPVAVCPVPRVGVAPMAPVGVPPLGTKRCEQKLVTNAYGAQEWKSVCY